MDTTMESRTLTVGCWRLERQISESPRASLWEAVHPSGARAAVKIQSAEAARDPVARARFLRQASVAVSLAGASTVQVLDQGTTHGGRPFIAFELAPGVSLDVLLARAPFDVEAALHVLRGILAALAAAHERGIVHGGLDPSSVVVARGGAVKLLGFGRVTPAGSVFTAPELADPTRTARAQADLWSAAAIFLHMLAPKLMCPRLAIAGDASAHVREAIARALRLDAHKRPSSAHALLAALDGRASEVTRCEPEAAPRQAFFEATDTEPLATIPRIRRAPVLHAAAS